MRFVGCALAWRPGEGRDETSCLVVLDERGSIIANSFATNSEEIAKAVEGYAENRRGVLLGVDAPLAVPNERGGRKVARVLAKLALPAYSASRNMFGGSPPSEEFLDELEKVGVEYTDYPLQRTRGQRVVVEVDSAATLKVLYLERSNGDFAQEGLREIGDPKLRKGNKEQRASALKSAIEVLWDTRGLRLRTGNLSADLGSNGNVDISKLELGTSLSHAEFDRVASLVEGTLAAYTVYRHWKGRDGSVVVGTGDQGSVLLPAPPQFRERISEECRAAGMPYA